MILDAKATLGVGQRLLRGNPEQLKMVDMALDYLEEDTARTLGEIREFSRYTDKLLTEEQIESGAAADEAAARFAEFSQKLLTAGDKPPVADMIQLPGTTATPAPANAVRRTAATSKDGGDYDGIFK
jgi:hypothetical protein